MSSLADNGPRVYWYGPVDKIGSNLAALPRVLFITPNSVLVCQPTGGVTRTILIEKLVEVILAPPAVVRVIVAQEPDLVVSLPTPNDRSDMMQALLSAFHETCGEGAEIPVTESTHLQMQSGGGGLSPIPQNTKGSSSMLESPFPLSSASTGNNSSVGIGVRNILTRLEDDASGTSQNKHSWTMPSGSANNRRPAGNSSSATTSSYVPNNQSSNTNQIRGESFSRGDSLSPPRAEALSPPQYDPQSNTMNVLRQQIDSQKRIIEQLQQDNVSGIAIDSVKKELDQAKALIADLQVALRSQEGAFSEMVKATEALKVSETIRSSQESQISAFREEIASLKQDVARRDQMDDEWRKRVASLEEGHRNEIQAVRDAFAKYDEQVTTYVEQLKREHETALRDVQQQKDSLLVHQGELQSRIDVLENEKRAIQAQKAALAGTVWRPQVQENRRAALGNPGDVSSEELRAALMAKLNRFADHSRPSPTTAAHVERPEEGVRNKTPTNRRNVSPVSGRMRDRSIL